MDERRAEGRKEGRKELREPIILFNHILDESQVIRATLRARRRGVKSGGKTVWGRWGRAEQQERWNRMGSEGERRDESEDGTREDPLDLAPNPAAAGAGVPLTNPKRARARTMGGVGGGGGVTVVPVNAGKC